MVVKAAIRRHTGIKGADIDDRTATGLDHCFTKNLGHQEKSERVDLENLAVDLQRDVFESIAATRLIGRLVDAGLSLSAGQFYDGTRITAGVRPRWSISPKLNFNGFFQLNQLLIT